MGKMETKAKLRIKRAHRVRRRIRGTSERPRLSVFKSNKHLSAQIVDDVLGKTVVGLSTYSKDFQGSQWDGVNRSSAAELGRRLAVLALGHQIEAVVFDRGPFKYHGVIAALADAAREAGLKF